jgi:hypothetical protein
MAIIYDKFVSFQGATLRDVNAAFSTWMDENPRVIKSFSREFYPALNKDIGYPDSAPRAQGNPPNPPGWNAPIHIIDVVYQDIA